MNGEKLRDEGVLFVVLLVLFDSDVESFDFVIFGEIVVDEGVEAEYEVVEHVLVVEAGVHRIKDDPNDGVDDPEQD